MMPTEMIPPSLQAGGMHITGYPMLFLLLLFSASMPFALMGLAQVLQFKADNLMKSTPYESGMVAIGDAKIQFDVKFYMYALLFILFDIETIFLFPWAMAFDGLGLYGLISMLVFIKILFWGLIYAWKKDALRWQ